MICVRNICTRCKFHTFHRCHFPMWYHTHWISPAVISPRTPDLYGCKATVVSHKSQLWVNKKKYSDAVFMFELIQCILKYILRQLNKLKIWMHCSHNNIIKRNAVSEWVDLVCSWYKATEMSLMKQITLIHSSAAYLIYHINVNTSSQNHQCYQGYSSHLLKIKIFQNKSIIVTFVLDCWCCDTEDVYAENCKCSTKVVFLHICHHIPHTALSHTLASQTTIIFPNKTTHQLIK